MRVIHPLKGMARIIRIYSEFPPGGTVVKLVDEAQVVGRTATKEIFEGKM